MCSSVALLIFRKLCSCHHCFQNFVITQRETAHIKHWPLSPPPASANFWSTSCLWISLLWVPGRNAVIHNLSFCDCCCTQHSVLGVHPCCSLCQNCLPCYGWVVFHCVDGQRVSCHSSSVDACFHTLAVVILLWTGVQISVQVPAFSCCGVYTQVQLRNHGNSRFRF